MKRKKKNPFKIMISSFVLAYLRVKKSQFGKSLELSKFLHHQLLGCVSKARSAQRELEPRSPRKAALLLQETSAEAIKTPPGPPSLAWKPGLCFSGATSLLPLFFPSFAPSWILNLYCGFIHFIISFAF